jgi:spermidine synthase
MKSLGRHIVVEFYDCDSESLNEVTHIEQSMLEAARKADATAINSSFHHFSPFGVSGVIVIQESHLAIHTWPEFGFAALDIFTCGDTVDPWVAYQELKTSLKASHGSAIEMGRGQPPLLASSKFDGSETAAHQPGELPPMKLTRNVWYTERDDDVAQSYRHTGDILFREDTPYQRVEVIESYAYGKMLLLDGCVMTTERDEYVYHEMITHVPLFSHPAPKRVCVIGGGDGGAVREALRHPAVEEVVLVEIDEAVVRATETHLPHIGSAFHHPQLDLRIQDGIQFMADTASDRFDLVIVDSTDPVGPSAGLFSETFYRNVYRALRTPGLLVTQSESPRYNVSVFQDCFACFRRIFGAEAVWCYLINVPTYPSGIWALSYSAKGAVHPLAGVDWEAAEQFVLQHNLRYYNPEVHRAAFALPNYVKERFWTEPETVSSTKASS